MEIQRDCLKKLIYIHTCFFISSHSLYGNEDWSWKGLCCCFLLCETFKLLSLYLTPCCIVEFDKLKMEDFVMMFGKKSVRCDFVCLTFVMFLREQMRWNRDLNDGLISPLSSLDILFDFWVAFEKRFLFGVYNLPQCTSLQI